MPPPNDQNSDEEQVPPPPQPTPTPEACGISFRAPEFWKTQPQLWFDRLECQFRTSRITADQTKFDYTVASLNCEALSEAADIVRKPPTANKYIAIKERLINRFSDSDVRKVQKLLSGMSLGDRKPSQLLHQMQTLNENQLQEHASKTLWMEHLPKHVRCIIAASRDDLQTLADVADRIVESMETTTINAVTATEVKPNNEIAALQQQVSELATQFKNFRARERSRPRPRNSPKDNQDNEHEGYCWYHAKYKNKARKCKPPCKAAENSNEDR